MRTWSARTCRRILGDETQAADAVQETFFQLTKDADRITGSLGSWLHKVATRRAVDVIRQNASRRRREQSYASDAVCRTDTWSEVEPAVDEALEQLPDNLREVLLLHFLQGRTTTQIAAAQGLSQPTISRRMNEGLELLRQVLRERGVQAGLVPLQTVLLHTNYIAPEALRYGLGKIALAKATLTGTAWAAPASAPAAAAGAKLALAGAALVLAAGTTWVAHKDFTHSPASIGAQTTVAQSAPDSPGSGAPQPSFESVPAQSASAPDPSQPRLQPDTTAAFSLPAPRGFVFPGRQAFAQGAPQVILPFTAQTNIQSAHTQKAGITNAQESPLSPPATNAPRARTAAKAPSWLYGASGAPEVYAAPGAYSQPAATERNTPDARAFNTGATVGPAPARGRAPPFAPSRPPAPGQKK
jgi:RNA polymerase sigma factor (sigma-70 family)